MHHHPRLKTLAGALLAATTMFSGAALAQDNIELRMAIWSANEAHLALFNEIAADYKTQHPNVTVTFDPLVYGDFVTALSTQIAGGNAPDLTWLGENTVADFVAAGALVPVGEVFRNTEGYDLDDYAPESIAAWSVNGVQYLYPFSTSPFGMFVNNDLIRAAGQKTPAELIAEGNWTWDAAIGVATEVAKTGKAGLVLRDFEYKDWSRLATVWTGWGAKTWSEDGKTCLFDQPEMVDALSFVHDAIFEKKALPGPGTTADFFAGDAAMTVTQISRASLLPKEDPFEWDLVPLPAGPKGEYGFVGSAGIAVLTASKHQDEAVKFLAFLSNKDNVAKLARFFPPTRRSLLTAEVLAKANPLLTEKQLADVVVNGITNGSSLAKHSGYEQIAQTIRASLDALWVPNADVKAVTASLCGSLTPLLQR